MEEKTCVIFRKDEFGVFAVFPEILGEMKLNSCTWYTMQGGHSSGDYDLILATSKPASKDDAKYVIAMLTNSYKYNLRIVTRASHKMHSKRMQEYNRLLDMQGITDEE